MNYFPPLDRLSQASPYRPITLTRCLPQVLAMLASSVSALALIVFEGKKYLLPSQECTPGVRDMFAWVECKPQGNWGELSSAIRPLFFRYRDLRSAACHYGVPIPGCVGDNYFHNRSIECTSQKYNHYGRKEACDPKDYPIKYDGTDDELFTTQVRVVGCKQGKQGIEGCDGKGNYYMVRERKEPENNWRSLKPGGEENPAIFWLDPETTKIIEQWLDDDKQKDKWGPLL